MHFDLNSAPKDDRVWRVLRTRKVYSAPPWIEVNLQEVLLPNGNIVLDYHQIRLPEYSVIYAEAVDHRIVVIRQYRHGLGHVSLMLPAGLIEPGESAVAAAQREFLEETGFQADQWVAMGSFIPNSNYGCGKAHFFRATNAQQIQEPKSGDLEGSEIRLIPAYDLLRAVERGEVQSLTVAAVIALATNRDFNV